MEINDLSKCCFVPMSTMQRVKALIENPMLKPNRQCKQNLLDLQLKGRNSSLRWMAMYQRAMARAVYAHDWNKLLYLLKSSPIWEHRQDQQLHELPIYIRALTILLMYHPSSKAQGLLNDYFHMVLSCRTDQDKKALLKVLLSLQEKIYKPKYKPTPGHK